MGMDLLGEKRIFRINWHGWREILKLAHSHGWKSEGTKVSDIYKDYKKWNGTYFSNSWQLVTRKDAKGIAKALKKSLKKLPKGWSQKQNKDMLKDFIDFCESGSFEIS